MRKKKKERCHKRKTNFEKKKVFSVSDFMSDSSYWAMRADFRSYFV